VDVGVDDETPVTEEYAAGKNAFTGRIRRVTVETKPPRN
jgi:arylsulfatase